jgi:ATP-independent RNA helicase DbpA
VTEDQRLHAVGLLLNHYRPVSTLAFCNTKQQCRDLVAVLQAQGFAALELHGDLEQRDRDQVLVRLPTAAAACWWPPTWPRAGWTSTSWKR